jgi:hypothetical protein
MLLSLWRTADRLDNTNGHLRARVDNHTVVQLKRSSATRDESVLRLVGEV